VDAIRGVQSALTVRRLRYCIAASLDGFIADVHGDYDWIVQDNGMDFAALFSQFDLFVMGRKTYETVRALGDADPMLGHRVVVFSRTLAVTDRPDVEIVSSDPGVKLGALKSMAGKDIWLYGGGGLARILLDARLVDTIEVAVMPILLGEGIPAVAPGPRVRLALESEVALRNSVRLLNYNCLYDA
jgi:dihydrofolate reductase